MLTRIRSIQQRVFTSISGLTRDRFKRTQVFTSTSGSSGRTVDLTGATVPIERILKVTLADGREASQVDELDTEAELAPRYFIRGTTLHEVSNDWSTSSGTISVTVLYVYGATAISVTGSSSSQNVSVPDEWIDVLVLPLAMYLHQKDPGRDPAEYARLEKMYEDTWADFLGFLTNYGGNESRRFVLPVPPESKKA